MTFQRRAGDTLRAVDGLLEAQLRTGSIDGRPLANLAAAMAIDYSGADRGSLLVDQGRGLVPVVALEGNLDRTPMAVATHDDQLVGEARASGSAQLRCGHIAAPVLIDGQVKGVLCLESDSDCFDQETLDLATAVATRIGTLLRSAELVDQLTRRTDNVATLESLVACLTAGELRQEHLDRAIEGVLTSTRSDDALLVLLGARGEPVRVTVRGDRPDELRALANQLAEALAWNGEAAGLEEPSLFEPFLADLVPSSGAEGERRAVGFLAVRRHDQPPYDDADRSFFRALTHLLSGALARLDYFNKAAEDPLTETGSRLALQLGLAEARAGALKTGRTFSVILVDIDRFKEINDFHGHLVGDEVLRGVAGLLRSRLRSADSVARYGGDEFVVILPDTGGREAVHLAEELLTLAAARRFTDKALEISLSMGVSSFAPDAEDVGAVLRQADEALYRSKTEGRNRVTRAGSARRKTDRV